MPGRATDVTLVSGEGRQPSMELHREDNRVLSESLEDAAPLPGVDAAVSTLQAPTYVQGRSRDRAAAELHDGSDSGESGPVHFPAASPTDTVVTPPFIPTGRHHDFFMQDEDSQHGGEGAEMSPREGIDTAQSPTATFDFVMSRVRSAVASLTTAPDTNTAPASSGAHEAAAPAPPRDVLPTGVRGGEDAPSAELATATAASTPDAEDAATVHASRRRKRRYSLAATAPPFDPAREQQWNLLSMGRDPTLPLYKFEEIPTRQKYNPYIRSGYRAFYTAKMCAKSLLGWHNETINVHSHFLTFVVFLIFTVLLYTTVLSNAITVASLGMSKLVYGVFCFGSLVCMLNSSIYHLFNSHCSHRVMTAMGRLDFIGITILIVTSFLPPLYVMFHCHPVARTIYIAAILVLGSAGIIGPWTDVFHEHVWVRVTVFLGLAFSGLVPAIHSVLLIPFNAASISTVLGIWLMVLLYLIGVVFYVTQFPESRYPGHFDVLLSSHQLWHFFVSMAALVHYFNCVSMYQLWQVSDGACA